MTNTRQVLEEAFKVIRPEPPRGNPLAPMWYWKVWIDDATRFRRFLDAEAWTDAALMMVPEGWRISNLAQHDHPLLRERGEWICTLYRDGQLGMLDRDTFCVRCNHATIPALAITEAALRAKEAGDV